MHALQKFRLISFLACLVRINAGPYCLCFNIIRSLHLHDSVKMYKITCCLPHSKLTAQVEALGGGTSTAVFVSVYSIANCLGRLCSGFLPDRMMSERDMPRTVSLIFLSALTFVACLLNAFARLEFFGISAAVTGFAFGGFQVKPPNCAWRLIMFQEL